jgi:hypothetical protein
MANKFTSSEASDGISVHRSATPGMRSTSSVAALSQDKIFLLVLDFDGVLHRRLATEWRHEEEVNKFFHFLPRFENVIRDYPCTQILIASAWRERRPFDELIQFFSEDIRSRILGVTPVHDHGGRVGMRQREVESWLSENGLQNVQWVALDDEPHNYLPDASLLICKDGFDGAEEKELRHLLDSRLSHEK